MVVQVIVRTPTTERQLYTLKAWLAILETILDVTLEVVFVAIWVIIWVI